MESSFKNKREAIAHLAAGGKITMCDLIMRMSDGGNLYIIGRDGKDIPVDINDYSMDDAKPYFDPHKYTVEVYFNKQPLPTYFNDGSVAYVFGHDVEFNSIKTADFNKKYQITVEEVR